MNKITKDNLNEFIKYYYEFHDSYITNVNYDIQFAGNIKTALFGGEGLTLATLTGPGTVWLQSLPLSRLADRIVSASKMGGGSKEEGSLLGGIGIGNFFGGNN